ncbi:RNA-binding protein 34 [Sarcoptes scabiei]|uniref:RNA-binding protein 34 n=1 Tax=Sarcoptes scabiei TaxID=52283 RepID=A0A834VA78_SARSC|nr:RNA-binding protein 34 [Sarcoptes scabiei]
MANKKDEIDDDGKKIDEISSTVKCSDGKNQERQKRTLFIGNLPANFPMKKLKQTLQQYGKVISIRIRCIAPAKITLSKKTALLSNQINPNKKNVNAYVVFKDEDSVAKALELNGQKFENNIIQVDTIENDRTYDHSKSLFLGNLSFKASEEELREFFNDCGPIQSIRIVRDSQTGIGKGFGYVNFKSNDSLVLALEKNGNLFKNREIRIKAYNYQKDSDKNIAAKKETTKMKKKTVKKVTKSSNEIPEAIFKAKKVLKN